MRVVSFPTANVVICDNCMYIDNYVDLVYTLSETTAHKYSLENKMFLGVSRKISADSKFVKEECPRCHKDVMLYKVSIYKSIITL